MASGAFLPVFQCAPVLAPDVPAVVSVRQPLVPQSSSPEAPRARVWKHSGADGRALCCRKAGGEAGSSGAACGRAPQRPR